MFGQPNTIEEFIDKLSETTYNIRKNNKKIAYYQIPCSLDIETSSFVKNGEKMATMYIGAIDINHVIYFFRSWHEMGKVFDALYEFFRLSNNRRLIIYVHNLSYEFQFMRKWIDWDKVFALSEREVVYAITMGFEFRCSYKLSGYSLENLAKIRKLPIKKLNENYDYKLLRTSESELSDDVYLYLINDVEIVVYYIEQLMKEEIEISLIPLTKTQYVRRYTRKQCSSFKYRKMMKSLEIDVEEYNYLKKAFAGGFTHANILNSNKIFENVSSYDFTSSYPAVMISEQFPMSSSERFNNPSQEIIDESLKYYCCILEVELYEVESRFIADHPLSLSKCDVTGKKEIDNGRIMSADMVKTVITEQDLMTIKEFYDIKDIKITVLYRYIKNYLPTDFIKAILDLYKIKTELKGVEDRETEYLNSKEMLNSEYGMTVTDILRDSIEYKNDEWGIGEKDIENEIDKYNTKFDRFLFYPWGVWVTAYARRNLFTAILELKGDYIYSDTDSVKFINRENHIDYFNRYNFILEKKLQRAIKYHNLDMELVKPKTINGKEKLLGEWDYDGDYTYFKTLGAKRYMTISKDTIALTVSGLNKNAALPYILEQCGVKYEKQHGKCKMFGQPNIQKIFDYFTQGMYIPKGKTGKNVHTYIDDECKCVIRDYNGKYCKIYEKSCIHLDEADYSLSLAEEYLNFIFGIRTVKA